MKRTTIKIRSSDDGKREIHVDHQNAEQILQYIRQDNRHKKKFNFITDLILGSLHKTELYDKEEINQQAKGVTAMKFFKGQENDRIYCKEITKADKAFVVIMVTLRLKKKSQKLTLKERKIIEKVASYEYELDE